MISVILAIQPDSVRERISDILSNANDIRFIEKTDINERLHSYIHQNMPNIVIIYVDNDNPQGFKTAAEISKNFSDVSVIIIINREIDEQVINVMQCGAHAYITEKLGSDEIINTIKDVAAGKYPVYHYLLRPVIALKTLSIFQSENAENTLSDAEELLLKTAVNDTSLIRISRIMAMNADQVYQLLSQIIAKLIENADKKNILKNHSLEQSQHVSFPEFQTDKQKENKDNPDSVYDNLKVQIKELEESITSTDQSQEIHVHLWNTFEESKLALKEAFNKAEQVSKASAEIAALTKRINQGAVDLAQRLTETTRDLQVMSVGKNQNPLVEAEKAEKITKYAIDMMLEFAGKLVRNTNYTIENISLISKELNQATKEAILKAEELSKNAWLLIDNSKVVLHESLNNLKKITGNNETIPGKSHQTLQHDSYSIFNFSKSTIFTETLISIITKETSEWVNNIDRVIEQAIVLRSEDHINQNQSDYTAADNHPNTGLSEAIRSISAWIALEESRKALQDALDRAKGIIDAQHSETNKEITATYYQLSDSTNIKANSEEKEPPSIVSYDQQEENSDTNKEGTYNLDPSTKSVSDKLEIESITGTLNNHTDTAKVSDSPVQDKQSPARDANPSIENILTEAESSESKESYIENPQQNFRSNISGVESDDTQKQNQNSHNENKSARTSFDYPKGVERNKIKVRLYLPLPVDYTRVLELQNLLKMQSDLKIHSTGGNREGIYIICSGLSPDIIFSYLSELQIIESATIDKDNDIKLSLKNASR